METLARQKLAVELIRLLYRELIAGLDPGRASTPDRAASARRPG